MTVNLDRRDEKTSLIVRVRVIETSTPPRRNSIKNSDKKACKLKPDLCLLISNH